MLEGSKISNSMNCPEWRISGQFIEFDFFEWSIMIFLIYPDQPKSTNIIQNLTRSTNLNPHNQDQPRSTKDTFWYVCLSLSYFPHIKGSSHIWCQLKMGGGGGPEPSSNPCQPIISSKVITPPPSSLVADIIREWPLNPDGLPGHGFNCKVLTFLLVFFKHITQLFLFAPWFPNIFCTFFKLSFHVE